MSAGRSQQRVTGTTRHQKPASQSRASRQRARSRRRNRNMLSAPRKKKKLCAIAGRGRGTVPMMRSERRRSSTAWVLPSSGRRRQVGQVAQRCTEFTARHRGDAAKAPSAVQRRVPDRGGTVRTQTANAKKGTGERLAVSSTRSGGSAPRTRRRQSGGRSAITRMKLRSARLLPMMRAAAHQRGAEGESFRDGAGNSP